jgi:integrase
VSSPVAAFYLGGRRSRTTPQNLKTKRSSGRPHGDVIRGERGRRRCVPSRTAGAGARAGAGGIRIAMSAGAQVKAVQRILGHASAAMTLDAYADLFDEDLESVATALDDARRDAGVGTAMREAGGFCGGD